STLFEIYHSTKFGSDFENHRASKRECLKLSDGQFLLSISYTVYNIIILMRFLMLNLIQLAILIIFFTKVSAQQKEFPKEIKKYVESKYSDKPENYGEIFYSDLNNDGNNDIVLQLVKGISLGGNSIR